MDAVCPHRCAAPEEVSERQAPPATETDISTRRIEFARSSVPCVVTTTERKGPTLMKRLLLFTSATLAALLAVAPARADLVDWTYDAQRVPVLIPADGGGTGGVGLSNEPSKAAVGSSDIVLTNVKVFS